MYDLDMKTVGLFEAKQKLSELVDRAGSGERIGITRRGKLAAIITSASPEPDLEQVFKNIENIRKHARPKNISVKSLIEEGRS
jgi:prevent-host-death family protein